MPDYYDLPILPFGTSTNAPTVDVATIKLFGCTVIDFNVSADWSSQGGSLTCRLIESETDKDRLVIPVLGSPVLFEMKRRSDGRVLFQYIGLVDSFSRSASTNSKTYTATLSSPLKILDATNVILDGYVGFGSSQEGHPDLTGIIPYDYGHKNANIFVGPQYDFGGTNHWWNISNLINVFAMLENDDILYRVPTFKTSDIYDPRQKTPRFGGFGFSGRSKDGIPLIKLMWALHIAINHVPKLDTIDPLLNVKQRQKANGGNLLYGRHNYNLYQDPEAVPYFYHFDAVHFYKQVVNKLGPQYRVEGQYKTLREIISSICEDANLEYFSYIDIYNPYSVGTNGKIIGEPTLLDEDKEWGKKAEANWPDIAKGWRRPMYPVKFTQKFTEKYYGNYGGTIRINTIDKNEYFNKHRPFSNIAYNLIGLEVPDLKNTYADGTALWTGNHKSGIHPGRRPVNETFYGLDGNPTPYSDPLDSSGLDYQYHGFMHNDYIAKVGTMSVAQGGYFPVDETGIDKKPVLFDINKLADIKIKSSDISIKLNDFVTTKIITGGYQTRIIHAPREMLRHYWGDIIVTGIIDPRTSNDVATDSFGLNEHSSRKIPIVTQLLDPKDIDDHILIDMKNNFGPIDVTGVLHQGIYAASLLEVRCAMASFESWKAFIDAYKYQKIRNLLDAFYPQRLDPAGSGQPGTTQEDLSKSTERSNNRGGLGYVGVAERLGMGNTFALNKTSSDSVSANNKPSGESKIPPGAGSGLFGLGINLTTAAAQIAIEEYVLPPIHEKIKDIGDTHYGKSWYAPVPYLQTAEDLDGNNLVGNFKRSWELTDSAYAEPSTYYLRKIPQSNMFVQDGKVSPFVNYDNSFVSSETGNYDTSYVQTITNLMGREQNVCNFSEYSLDQLCFTRYSVPSGIDESGNILYGASGQDIIHASPESVSNNYEFLPVGYDLFYNRAALPFSDIIDGVRKKYSSNKTLKDVIPSTAGQTKSAYQKDWPNKDDIKEAAFEEIFRYKKSTTNKAECDGAGPNQIDNEDGFFDYQISIGIPAITHTGWLPYAVSGLQSLDYLDNGRFSFPFVKFSTSRVFLPVPLPGASGSDETLISDVFNVFLDTRIKYLDGQTCVNGNRIPTNRKRQHLITEDSLVSVLNPFQACVVPKSFNYCQVSTRHVYGPWITNLPSGIAFRGKIDYQQDDSLVPENFLIPTNLGQFGEYRLDQTSGFAGLDLAAQGRANAIDDFALFAVEEGSITLPGTPGITRIGDSLYGIQQVTDIKINVNNDRIETTYGFKTMSPKFGKNPRDLEKKMTKISNDIKKLKLR